MRILLYLLGLLGFASCGKTEDLPPVMYGTPTAEFMVKGRVVDPDGNPVENIRVTPLAAWRRTQATDTFIPDNELESDRLCIDPLRTDADGTYEFEASCFDFGRFQVRLKVEDTDGEEHGGLFRTAETDVAIDGADLIGSGSWVRKYAKQAENIVLERATGDEPEEPGQPGEPEKPEQPEEPGKPAASEQQP